MKRKNIYLPLGLKWYFQQNSSHPGHKWPKTTSFGNLCSNFSEFLWTDLGVPEWQSWHQLHPKQKLWFFSNRKIWIWVTSLGLFLGFQLWCDRRFWNCAGFLHHVLHIWNWKKNKNEKPSFPVKEAFWIQ